VYRFAGFFAKPIIARPESLPGGVAWRCIAVPFEGVGVRVAALIGQSPELTEVNRVRTQVGLQDATNWLYLTYDCWAGRVEYVYGLGSRSGVPFGPVKESDISRVPAAYVAVMGSFGVQPADALRFPPFVGGFWGEAQPIWVAGAVYHSAR
jgi:hypothetical protein